MLYANFDIGAEEYDEDSVEAEEEVLDGIDEVRHHDLSTSKKHSQSGSASFAVVKRPLLPSQRKGSAHGQHQPVIYRTGRCFGGLAQDIRSLKIGHINLIILAGTQIFV